MEDPKKIESGVLKTSIVIVSLILLVVIIFILIVLLTLFQAVGNENISNSEYVQYQELRVNPITKRTTLLERKNGRYDQSFTYVSSRNGDHVLISKMGDREYICKGSCYCVNREENHDRRSSSATLLTRGMYYLVAGVSSVLAVNEARRHFHSECVNVYSDTCSEDSIESEVEGDDCDTVYRDFKDIDKPTLNEIELEKKDSNLELLNDILENFEQKEDNEGERKIYLCEGRCLDSPKLYEGVTPNCGQYGREGFRTDVIINRWSEKQGVDVARAKFAFSVLDTFCNEKGPVNMEPICVNAIDGLNPTVKCVEEEKVEE